MTQEPKQITDSLRREIKKYNIMGLCYVRGGGSPYGKHKLRCFWELGGKPMLQWNLEVGLASKYVNKVVLSSEDAKILKFGEDMEGVTVIPRPLDTIFEMPRDFNAGVFQKQSPRSLFSSEPFRDPEFTHWGEVGKAAPIMYTYWYMQEYESYVAQIFVNLPANEPLSTAETLDRLIEAFFLDEEANRAQTIYEIMPGIVRINSKTNQLSSIVYEHGLDKQSYDSIYRLGPFLILGKPLRVTFNSTFRAAWIIIDEEEATDIHNKEDLIRANQCLERRLERQKKGGEKEVK